MKSMRWSRRRGAGLGGGHDEREQTLNQLLVEMDGFQKNEGVIVLAATNRQDILDPALMRPGRFDRQIYVGTPDVQGRQDILKIYARDKRLDEQVDLKAIALATAGFTGADLENLLNEAAILAVREKRQVITTEDLNEAMMKIIAGPQKEEPEAAPAGPAHHGHSRGRPRRGHVPLAQSRPGTPDHHRSPGQGPTASR